MLVRTVTASTISSGHLRAARSVDRQHAHAKLLSFGDGCSDGVRNVVILQIEKHSPTGRDEIAHDLRSYGGIQLHPHLVGQGGVSHRRHNLLCGGGGRNVKRNDEPLARITTSIANAIGRDAVGQSSRHPG
jgi:hypothetical protein